MNEITFELISNTKAFKIPTKFGQLEDIPSDIYNSLFFSKNHQYEIKSKVKDEVFESFIQFMVKEEAPMINIDNFSQYEELSNEFNLMKELVKQKKKEIDEFFCKKKEEKEFKTKQSQTSISDQYLLLMQIINSNNEKINNIKESTELTKVQEKREIENLRNLINEQAKAIEGIKTKQEKDITLNKNTQEEQFNILNDTFHRQKKDIVRLKYKSAEDIDKIGQKIKNTKLEIPQGPPSPKKFQKKDHQKNHPGEAVDILYDSTQNGRFQGIINYLTQECNGNVHEKGAVNITSSSVFHGEQRNVASVLRIVQIPSNCDFNPLNAANFNDKIGCFESDDLPDSWICYDFVDAKVKPNAYSIRTYMNGHSHMMCWRVEGSNDNANWTKLDERVYETSISEPGGSNTFNIEDNNANEYFRYLRLMQIDQNMAGSYILNISALEFFGSFLE